MANPSKAKGTKFAQGVAEYLNEALHDDYHAVERRAQRGALDTGDIAGIAGMVIEAKNHKAMDLGMWLNEAEREADVDGGSLPVVWHKRRGQAHPASNYVTMPGWAFVELLKAWL